MTNLMKRAFAAGLAMVLPFALAPAGANAQEEAAPAEQEVCTALLTPASVTAGQSAVAIEARFSQDIGDVDELVAPEESGLALAHPDDPMAEQDVAEEGAGEEGGEYAGAPAEEGLEEIAHTVWLDASNGTPGTYQVTFKGSAGECTADVTVIESGVEPEAGGAQ